MQFWGSGLLCATQVLFPLYYLNVPTFKNSNKDQLTILFHKKYIYTSEIFKAHFFKTEEPAQRKKECACFAFRSPGFDPQHQQPMSNIQGVVTEHCKAKSPNNKINSSLNSKALGFPPLSSRNYMVLNFMIYFIVFGKLIVSTISHYDYC